MDCQQNEWFTSWINEKSEISRNHYRASHRRKSVKERETDRETEGGRESCWRSYLDISFLLLVFTLSNCYYYFFWTWQMQKMKPIQVTYNHSFHTLYKWKACSSQKQQQQPDLRTCLNNSFQLFADTLTSKFENLTNKIVEKSPSRAKAKGKRHRKGRQSDDGKASSEPSSDSEGEIKEQIRPRKKKQKIKINSSRDNADERKECHKGSVDDESEHENDDRVSLHADDDSEPAGNLNNILGTNKESEDKDSDSENLKGFNTRTWQRWKTRGKISKDLADIANKV